MIHIKVQINTAVEWMGVIKEDLAMDLEQFGKTIVSDIQPVGEDGSFILFLDIHALPDSEHRIRQALNSYLQKFRDLRLLSFDAEHPVQLQF